MSLTPNTLERYLHHVKVEWPVADEAAAGARVRLADRLPRTALRRMTHLGMLIGGVLDGAPLGSTDALVYATSFAESRALEDYLASFPSPSPMLFQTSIHPGGVQQVLIPRQQPIARLWPMAGRRRLVEQALLAALIEPAATVALVGGEERGTWLLEHGMASDTAFAFCTLLSTDAAGAIGRVEFARAEGTAGACPDLPTFALALRDRQPLTWASSGGTWRLTWL